MLKKELGMASNFCAEAHQNEGGQPAPDVGASTAGGEQGAMPTSDAGAPTAGGERGAMPASTSPKPKD